MKLYFYFFYFFLSGYVCAADLTASFNRLIQKLQDISQKIERFGIARLQYDMSFRLTKLTNEQIEAGVIGSKYYNDLFVRPNAATLHRQGHIINEQFLDNFFFNSIFQYYVYEFLRYDCTFDYLQFKDASIRQKKVDIKKFDELNNRLSNKLIQGNNIRFIYIESIIAALNDIRTNEFFKKLGIAYQRYKIIVEKFEGRLRTLGNSNLQPKLLELDLFLTDIQTLVFHFMKTGFEEYLKRLQHAKNDQEIKNAGMFLSTFKPDWFQAPYYKTIIDNIDEYTQPKSAIDVVLSDGTTERIDIPGYP